MRQLAILTSFAALLACGGDDQKVRVATDAGTAPIDATVQDSGEIDLNSLLIAELIETEGSLLARCPCLISAGMYETTSQCMDAVGLGRNWVDCASRLDLSAFDNPQTREKLRCNIEDQKQRGACLMGSVCTDDAVAMCMTESLTCDQIPVALFSEFAIQCQIAFSH